ncbi:MAG TPA: alpha/beta fold hydrolase [Sphingomicrobium sp.]|nr:alpha/beta fold hydrolase [Sphingomicrobium sp.]
MAAAPPAASAAPTSQICHSGGFRLSDGQIVAIGGGAENSLRYRLTNGGLGRLYPQPDGTYAGGPGLASPSPPEAAKLAGACGALRLTFSAPGVPSQTAVKVPLTVKTQAFQSGDTELRGRLVAPAGRSKKRPLVVLVHGSEESSAVDLQLEQYWLPAQGVAVFVYDKRGTGESKGKYTQNFEVLSSDAVAAMTEAKRLLGRRGGPAGFWGGSQGGWVAPLAARKAAADFVVVSYGMAQSPLDEDREEVFDNLRRAGYGADVLAKAKEITDAAGKIMASRFTQGFEEFDAARAKYRNEPWFKMIKGEFTGEMLAYPSDAIRQLSPTRDRGTTWDYDAYGTLKSLGIPMLWVLAEKDEEAPSATTLSILRNLQREKPELDVAVYPDTDHGIMHFVEKNGERQNTRLAASYQTLVTEWIRTRRLRPAKDVVLYPATADRARQRKL